MSNYNFLQLNNENIGHLYALYEIVYQKKCADNLFEHKYKTHNKMRKPIAIIAMNKNKPIGFYGIVPMLFSINKEVVQGGQVCDNMIHPEYRSPKLFVELGKQTLALANTNGIHFVIGFPNQNSYLTSVKLLGFDYLGMMNRYEIYFSKTLFKRLHNKLKMIRFKKSYHTIENSLINEGFDGVIYDRNYINYKSFHKNKLIQNNQFTFWVNYTNQLWLGAFSKNNDNSYDNLIETLAKTFKTQSLTYIVSGGTKINEYLEKKYQAQKGFPILVKNLSNKYSLTNLKFQFCDNDIF
jgi:hypothetical protein